MPARIDAVLRYADLGPERLAGRCAVVIDVLRATSSICFALAAGCRAVMPFETVEDLRRRADRMSPGEALLGGERGGLKIDGFDLGNSPAGYTPEICAGRTLLITTTNGTRAIYAAAAAEALCVACMANVFAVADALAGAGRDIVVVCSGTNERFACDDAICAGALIDAMQQRGEVVPEGGAAQALQLFEQNRGDITGAFRRSEAGRALAAVGLGADVEFCAAPPQLDIVPKLDRRRMTLSK